MMYHHIAGVDFNRCEKKTNCANCSEAQQRQCEQELDQSYKSKTAKETLRTLNKALKEKGHQNEEATRYKGEYYLLHICRNGAPVPLYHSKDASEVRDYIDTLNN